MASGRPIDHVVLVVRDLGATAAIYQELGFTLTPRAVHEDRMGTSNRLVQFKAKNFIELLEVDRPETLAPHDFTREPPFFSFGDHNRRAVAAATACPCWCSPGTMPAPTSTNSKGLACQPLLPSTFKDWPGSPTAATSPLPFRWPSCNRRTCQTWPSLFAKIGRRDTSGSPSTKAMPMAPRGLSRCICRHRRRSAMPPSSARCSTQRSVPCRTAAAGWPADPPRSCVCSPPRRVARRDGSLTGLQQATPRLAGIAVSAPSKHGLTPAAQAGGMFIEWVPA